MPAYPNLLLVGISGETKIYADRSVLGERVGVTLTASYTPLHPSGWPRPYPMTTDLYDGPVPEGTSIFLFMCEAEALVTAGGATFD
jgi:hypothetical protein